MGIKIPRDPTVEKLKLKSKAVKTQQSYDGDWLKFVQYSKTRFNADPLEVDGIQDAYNLTEGYLNWLHTNSDAIKLKGKSEKNNPNAPSSNSNNKSYKSSTIKRILASITYKYRINNFDFDRKNPQIAETMAAISRNKEIKPGQKKELLKEDIIKIVDPLFNSDNATDIRDKALILLGFYSFCRRSEILGMKFNHLEFLDEGIQILIPFSKTDQIGEGRYIFIAKKNDKYCPVNSLKKWLEIIRIENEDPLFYSINKSNKFNKYMLNKKNQKISLSDSSFVKILKNRAQLAGLNEIEKISGHSLRRGAISEARRNDLSINDIKAQSGHKSSQMIDLYSKVSDIKKTSVTKKI